jgi:hypothetical protein
LSEHKTPAHITLLMSLVRNVQDYSDFRNRHSNVSGRR